MGMSKTVRILLLALAAFAAPAAPAQRTPAEPRPVLPRGPLLGQGLPRAGPGRDGDRARIAFRPDAAIGFPLGLGGHAHGLVLEQREELLHLAKVGIARRDF